jgi:hypothetical protein
VTAAAPPPSERASSGTGNQGSARLLSDGTMDLNGTVDSASVTILIDLTYPVVSTYASGTPYSAPELC